MCPRQTPLAPLYAAVVKTDPLPHRYEACIVAHCQRSGTQYHSAFSSSGGMSAQCLLLGGLRVGTLGHCFPKLALVPSRGAPVCTVHGGQGDGVQQLLHLWQRGTQEIETNRGDCGAHRGKPDPPLTSCTIGHTQQCEHVRGPCDPSPWRNGFRQSQFADTGAGPGRVVGSSAVPLGHASTALWEACKDVKRKRKRIG